jgi:4,5-DOPA dioxygenase extradiol
LDRKDFIKALALIPLGGMSMNLNTLKSITDKFDATSRMPLLFLGHGSPMNAIEDNEYTRAFNQVGKSLPTPKAILCVSAHWETKGTFVTAMDMPKTIHDFGGFPKALNEFQYPAKGSSFYAKETQALSAEIEIGLDYEWGLDHGAWSVLCHLFPNADIPVYQLSLDYRKDPLWHYEFAKQLSSLRDRGVLIVGSGNIVHNLRSLNWNSPEAGFDWAVEANETIKKLVFENDYKSLSNYRSLGRAVEMAVPSPDHYLPLLYTLGMKEKSESIQMFNDKTIMGSISMTSFQISS